MSAAEHHEGVKARVAVVDPSDATVLWANDPEISRGAGLIDFLPMAESLGVLDALKAVAESGRPRHLHTGVVSMSRGSISLVVSLHRLPDKTVIVISEHGWQATPRDKGGSSVRERHRSR